MFETLTNPMPTTVRTIRAYKPLAQNILAYNLNQDQTNLEMKKELTGRLSFSRVPVVQM